MIFLSNGHRTVRSSVQFGRFQRKIKTWVNNNSYVFTTGTPPKDYVSITFMLKDGHNWAYNYFPPYGTSMAVGLVNNLQHVPPPLIGGWTGGRLFNFNIRPQLWQKKFSPP